MNDDEMRDIWEQLATPKAGLLHDAARLIAAGDVEICAARDACVAAWRNFQAIKSSWETVKQIPDASYLEVRAMLSAETAAYMGPWSLQKMPWWPSWPVAGVWRWRISGRPADVETGRARPAE
ncbi:MAG: hypothetical protein ACLQUY_22800 [Ktedonobacterales bacterium]